MVRIPLLALAVWALMALSLGGALPGPALAAAITVNTFTDELNADGDCSLREAVLAANTDAAVDACAAGSGADTINLQAGNYPRLLPLPAGEDAAATGDLDLMGTVTITGNNTTVKGSGERAFHVLAGATATISGITVVEGNTGFGGGILNAGTLTLTDSTVSENNAGEGGGLYNSGTLTLNNSSVTANHATSGNTDGGGIYSTGGTVTLTNSAVSDNDATTNGGGVYVAAGEFILTNSTVTGNDATLGGGIYKTGTVFVAVPVTLNGSTVSGNGASTTQGGGIHSAGGLVTLNDSVVSANSATSQGGGVYTAAGTSLIVNGGSISGNTSSGTGGGVHGASGSLTELTGGTVSGNSAAAGGGIFSLETMILNNSTVSDNGASSGGGVRGSNGSITLNSSTISGNVGGGVYGDNVILTVSNSTISGNFANADGGGIYIENSSGSITSSTLTGNSAGAGFFGGAIYKDGGAALTLTNSILANSLLGGNCLADLMISAGYNLSSDSTCGLNAVLGDWIGFNPVLGPLANNGGPTRTHALLGGSVAIDNGLLTFEVPCSGGDDFDQRGVLRPQGMRCDIGAYEADDSDGDGSPDPQDLDDDGDTVPDSLDSCPLAAEDIDGWQDEGGCPDTDNDSDGICDAGQTSVACTGSDSGKYCFDPAATLACHIAPTSDCRNVAEDFDAFKDTDGCPEPDNDNDGFLDGTDVCPGTGSQAGADTMLGSPQDLNHNGISNGGEATLTSDDVTRTFEDDDGVLDTDGCHDSPGEDFDADGYTDDNEALFIGTNAGYPCGFGGWPSDLLSTGLSTNKLDVQDIISFIAPVRRLDTSPNQIPPSNYLPRWDLAPGANFPFPNHISIFDITTMLNGTPGSPAYPQMFGGPRAFLKECPLAPQ